LTLQRKVSGSHTGCVIVGELRERVDDIDGFFAELVPYVATHPFSETVII